MAMGTIGPCLFICGIILSINIVESLLCYTGGSYYNSQADPTDWSDIKETVCSAGYYCYYARQVYSGTDKEYDYNWYGCLRISSCDKYATDECILEEDKFNPGRSYCTTCCAENLCNDGTNSSTSSGHPAPTTTNLELETNCGEPLILEEGGDELKITFKSQINPEDICANQEGCEIYAVLSIEEKTSPRCPSKRSLRQIVCRPDYLPPTRWPCSLKITVRNWKDFRYISVAAVQDGRRDGIQRRQVHLLYKKVVNGEEVDEGLVATCNVNVVDHDSRSYCRSQNDPHMTSFDGKYYEHQMEGVFILYKHTTLPAQVQAEFKHCGWGSRVFCNCAVAVTYAGFHVVLDVCDGAEPELQYFSLQKDTHRVRIFKRSNIYEIQMPHGTKVIFQVWKPFISHIQIIPSSADYGKTEGLCGNFDGNPGNDYKLANGKDYFTLPSRAGQPTYSYGYHPFEFSISWKSNSKKFILKKDDQIPEDPEAPEAPVKPLYCVCVGDGCIEISCDSENIKDTCIGGKGEIPKSEIQENMKHTNQWNSNPRRKKRQSGSQGSTGSVMKTWNTSAAQEYCQKLFDSSSVASSCVDKVGTDIDYFINEVCVTDILVVDDTIFAEPALMGFTETCKQELISDGTLSETDAGIKIFDGIFNEICPEDCNGHGTCSAGDCNCHTGWVGDACGTRSDAVPHSLTSSSQPICDINTNYCHLVRIIAVDIIVSPSLTCHFKQLEVTRGRTSGYKGDFTVAGYPQASGHVVCRMPIRDRLGAFHVSLSNDKIHQSPDVVLHIINDPTCYRCGFVPRPFCEPQSFSCVVNGKCYHLRDKIDGKFVCPQPVRQWKNSTMETTTARELNGTSNYTSTEGMPGGQEGVTASLIGILASVITATILFMI